MGVLQIQQGSLVVRARARCWLRVAFQVLPLLGMRGYDPLVGVWDALKRALQPQDPLDAQFPPGRSETSAPARSTVSAVDEPRHVGLQFTLPRDPKAAAYVLAQWVFDQRMPESLRWSSIFDLAKQTGIKNELISQAYNDIEWETENPIRVEVLTDFPRRVIDLSSLDTVRLQVAGTPHWVRRRDAGQFLARTFLLIREPENLNDKNAIAVYVGKRKVGFVPLSRAASMSPLLSRLDADAFSVDGASEVSWHLKLSVDLPRVPELRAFVKTQTS